MSVNIDKEFEELRKDFLYHAEDLTLKLNSIISNQNLDKETFKEVFRIVHSLKGGAASHEFTNLSTLKIFSLLNLLMIYKITNIMRPA